MVKIKIPDGVLFVGVIIAGGFIIEFSEWLMASVSPGQGHPLVVEFTGFTKFVSRVSSSTYQGFSAHL